VAACAGTVLVGVGRPAFLRHVAIALSRWVSTLGVGTLALTDAVTVVLVDVVPLDVLVPPEDVELHAPNGSTASASAASAPAPTALAPGRRVGITGSLLGRWRALPSFVPGCTRRERRHEHQIPSDLPMISFMISVVPP
jgi:hypothetical protein